MLLLHSYIWSQPFSYSASSLGKRCSGSDLSISYLLEGQRSHRGKQILLHPIRGAMCHKINVMFIYGISCNCFCYTSIFLSGLTFKAPIYQVSGLASSKWRQVDLLSTQFKGSVQIKWIFAIFGGHLCMECHTAFLSRF